VQRMTLGDALIAGTALVHSLVLVTRNINDWGADGKIQFPPEIGHA